MLIQMLDKLLYISPGDVFYRPIRVTNEATRVRTHHRFPLRLRDRVLPQIKRLADGDKVSRLFMIIC